MENLSTAKDAKERKAKSEVIHHTANAFLQMSDVKVNQKTQPDATEFHVGQQLRFVNGRDCVDGLQFDDQAAVHEYIDSVSDVEMDSFVNEGKWYLRLDMQSSFPKFPCETRFVRTLQQAGPERCVDAIGAVQNDSTYVIHVNRIMDS